MKENEVLKLKRDKYGTSVALVNRHTEYDPFVVAWDYRGESRSWGQGHYFNDIEDAVAYFAKY